MNVELARDVGKSAEEREKLTQGIEDRNKEKDRRAKEASEILGATVSADELLRYELCKEQNFKCVYCDAGIAPEGLLRQRHALSSRSHPALEPVRRRFLSEQDVVLRRLQSAQTRAHTLRVVRRTRSPQDWDAYAARVEGFKEMKGLKKRNFKLKDAASVEDKFRARNLTDTQWATRLLADELKRMFPPKADERRVFTRPGAITSKLRRAWGLEGQKKVNGARVADDRHHAIDADRARGDDGKPPSEDDQTRADSRR